MNGHGTLNVDSWTIRRLTAAPNRDTMEIGGDGGQMAATHKKTKGDDGSGKGCLLSTQD